METKYLSKMNKNLYIAPVLTIEQAEAQNMMVLSLDTSKAEWRDNVNLEAKEAEGSDDYWDIEW